MSIVLSGSLEPELTHSLKESARLRGRLGPNIAGMKEELWPDQSLEGPPVGRDYMTG